MGRGSGGLINQLSGYKKKTLRVEFDHSCGVNTSIVANFKLTVI